MELSEQDVEDGLKVLERYCQQTYGIEIDDDALCEDIVADNELLTTGFSAEKEANNNDTTAAEVTGDGSTSGPLADAPAEAMLAVKSSWRWLTFTFDRLGLNQLVMIGLVGLYALFGGCLFHFIEAPHEARLLQDAQAAAVTRHARFARILANVSTSANCSQETTALDVTWCEAAIVSLLEAYDDQAGLSALLVKDVWDWDYFNSVSYSASLFTTIGYGRMYCKTDLGRSVTMLYALIGIPLTLILLKNLGGTIFTWVDSGWKNLQRFSDTLPLPLVMAIVFIYTVVCTFIFVIWENEWNYFTGFYFFFISLTTIGLGDVMPEHPTYALGFLFFFIVGQALLSMCVNVMHSRMEAKYMAALHLIDLRTRPRPIILPKAVVEAAAILQPDADGAAVLASLGLPSLLKEDLDQTAPSSDQPPPDAGINFYVNASPPDEVHDDPRQRGDGSACVPVSNSSHAAQRRVADGRASSKMSLSLPPALTQVQPPAVLGVLVAERRQQKREQLAAAASSVTRQTSRRSSFSGSMLAEHGAAVTAECARADEVVDAAVTVVAHTPSAEQLPMASASPVPQKTSETFEMNADLHSHLPTPTIKAKLSKAKIASNLTDIPEDRESSAPSLDIRAD